MGLSVLGPPQSPAGERVQWGGDGSEPTLVCGTRVSIGGRCISGKPGPGFQRKTLLCTGKAGRGGWLSEAPAATSRPAHLAGPVMQTDTPSALCPAKPPPPNTHPGPVSGPSSLCRRLQRSLTSGLQPDLSLRIPPPHLRRPRPSGAGSTSLLWISHCPLGIQ